MTKKSKQKELLRWNKRHFSLFLKGCLPKIVTDLKVRLWNRKLVLSSSENVRKNIPFQMFYHADDIASSVLFTNRKPRILLLKLLGCFKQLEPGDFQRFVSITKQALMVLSSSSTGKKKATCSRSITRKFCYLPVLFPHVLYPFVIYPKVLNPLRLTLVKRRRSVLIPSHPIPPFNHNLSCWIMERLQHVAGSNQKQRITNETKHLSNET